MDIRIVDSNNNIVESKEPEMVSHAATSAPALPEMLTNAVEQIVGLDDEADRYRYKNSVDTLLEWAKTKTKDHTPEGIKWAIRQLEMSVGTTPFAEKKAPFLARYAYLEMEKKKIDDELNTYKI